jgi:maltodextrin utilization protein YvdJ
MRKSNVGNRINPFPFSLTSYDLIEFHVSKEDHLQKQSAIVEVAKLMVRSCYVGLKVLVLLFETTFELYVTRETESVHNNFYGEDQKSQTCLAGKN